jgi:hypothetical protein
VKQPLEAATVTWRLACGDASLASGQIVLPAEDRVGKVRLSLPEVRVPTEMRFVYRAARAGQASVYSYISVRRRAAGDESGAVEMMKKAAATNAVTELQWYESELRLRIASGKIPSPRQPEAGRWQDNLPRPPENVSDR